MIPLIRFLVVEDVCFELVFMNDISARTKTKFRNEKAFRFGSIVVDCQASSRRDGNPAFVEAGAVHGAAVPRPRPPPFRPTRQWENSPRQGSRDRMQRHLFLHQRSQPYVQVRRRRGETRSSVIRCRKRAAGLWIWLFKNSVPEKGRMSYFNP